MTFLYWTHILVLFEWLIRLTLLPVIVLRKERPATCLAWLAIVFFEPVLGLVFYVLIGENRLGRRRLERRRSRHRSIRTGYPGLDTQHVVDPDSSREAGVLVHLTPSAGGLPIVDGNCVAFMADTANVIDRLLLDIEAAQHHVHLLFYIFENDEVGQRVATALIRARQRGVACRVLADAVGSRKMFSSLAPLLRQHDIKVLPVLPVNLLRIPFARLDLRNHRKLAVIDGRIAYTGSQNIVEPSYGQKRAGPWHDLMARITGPVVHQLQEVFLEDWFHETNELLEASALFPENPVQGPVAIQVVPTGPDLPTEQFQDLIVKAIFMAQQRVTITSPYFVPGEAMLLALRMAALRGVGVDLVIPRRTDHPIVDAAGSFYGEYLMRFGVRVYLHRQGLLHAKTLAVDDKLAMFGSANYDIRSFDLNFELNLLLHAREAVAELRALQQHYLQQSDEASSCDWPRRTLPNRLKMNLAKLFSPLL